MNNKLNNNIKLENFQLKSNKEIVLNMIECYPDSPIYDQVSQEYENLNLETKNMIKPIALLKFGELKESFQIKNFQAPRPVCYVFYTIGDEIKDLSKAYFDQGNYLAGMLVNAIADDYLMEMGQELEEIIEEQCKDKGIGVIERLTIPKDMPMEAQKLVLQETKADKILNIGLTEGYMFTSVKSNCFILILSDDASQMNLKHDCSKCDMDDCKLRQDI